MTEAERAELLADEWLIVRNSGEIPEITYHASLYFIAEDPEGPALELNAAEKKKLQDAAVQRYQEIILRDLQIENFHKSVYRGIRRTIYNWHRCKAFGQRQDLDCNAFRQTVAEALLLFLQQGIQEVGESLPGQFLNCHFATLLEFVVELQVDAEQLPPNLELFCVCKNTTKFSE